MQSSPKRGAMYPRSHFQQCSPQRGR
jgi:hypothetical protein